MPAVANSAIFRKLHARRCAKSSLTMRARERRVLPNAVGEPSSRLIRNLAEVHFDLKKTTGPFAFRHASHRLQWFSRCGGVLACFLTVANDRSWHFSDIFGLALNVRITAGNRSVEASRASFMSLARRQQSRLIHPLSRHANLPVPCRMRGPVRVPSCPGTGPASWVVPGSMGQEAFDSFARPLETGVRRCETAVKPGDTAWTGVPSKASGETADNSVKRVRVSPCARPESEGMRA